MLSKFSGTSTPKGSYRAKTGDNDCNINSSHYSLSTALCESIHYQAKSEQKVRQDQIPRVGHGEAAVSTPRGVGLLVGKPIDALSEDIIHDTNTTSSYTSGAIPEKNPASVDFVTTALSVLSAPHSHVWKKTPRC